MEKYYTAKEVADILKVNIQTIFKWLRESKLPSDKVGGQYRITEKHLEQFIKRG